jgi:hypothetical protein
MDEAPTSNKKPSTDPSAIFNSENFSGTSENFPRIGRICPGLSLK